MVMYLWSYGSMYGRMYRHVCIVMCVFYGHVCILWSCIYGHMVVCMAVVVVTYVGGYPLLLVLIGLWMFSSVYGPKTSHGR